jgi:hypothetical protein
VLKGLKREELVATNSMLQHERYFESLRGAGVEMVSAMALDSRVSFGSVARWRDEFVALDEALLGSSGWVQPRLVDRTVRAYLVNGRVAGVGHQAVNALHPGKPGEPRSSAWAVPVPFNRPASVSVTRAAAADEPDSPVATASRSRARATADAVGLLLHVR